LDAILQLASFAGSFIGLKMNKLQVLRKAGASAERKTITLFGKAKQR
jgi:hypothetical protein